MTVQWLETPVETPIVEMHVERLEAGREAEMLWWFEAELIDRQEALGARVLGSFYVGGDRRRLLWLRGFPHMGARTLALRDFYSSGTWYDFRRDFGGFRGGVDSHLLRAVAPSNGLPVARLPRLENARPGTPYRALVSELRFEELVGNYHLWLRLFLRKAGADPLASFATLALEPDRRLLPVARNRTIHVALLPGTGELPQLPRELLGMLREPPQLLELEPTARSRLR